MLTSKHISELLFSNLSSQTPLDRTLKRLVGSKLLTYVERRSVGGKPGGSGVYVYKLGPAALGMFGDYKLPPRGKWEHTLAIADFYVMLHELERGGYLRITDYSTEPDCWLDVEDKDETYHVRPDLYVEWVGPNGIPIRRFIEIHMGSQTRAEITWKFNNYWGGYRVTDVKVWPEDQSVLFVAVSDMRVSELKRWLARMAGEVQPLFRMQTSESLKSELSTGYTPTYPHTSNLLAQSYTRLSTGFVAYSALCLHLDKFYLTTHRNHTGGSVARR